NDRQAVPAQPANDIGNGCRMIVDRDDRTGGNTGGAVMFGHGRNRSENVGTASHEIATAPRLAVPVGIDHSPATGPPGSTGGCSRRANPASACAPPMTGCRFVAGMVVSGWVYRRESIRRPCPAERHTNRL